MIFHHGIVIQKFFVVFCRIFRILGQTYKLVFLLCQEAFNILIESRDCKIQVETMIVIQYGVERIDASCLVETVDQLFIIFVSGVHQSDLFEQIDDLGKIFICDQFIGDLAIARNDFEVVAPGIVCRFDEGRQNFFWICCFFDRFFIIFSFPVGVVDELHLKYRFIPAVVKKFFF